MIINSLIKSVPEHNIPNVAGMSCGLKNKKQVKWLEKSQMESKSAAQKKGYLVF